MPSNREVQKRRREAIRAILMAEDPPVADQAELVRILKERGFPATQSSVSRDLRDLGAIRWDGRYQILDWNEGESPLGQVRGVVLRMLKVEPQQILLVTLPGAGALVADAIEACGWEDVVGINESRSSLTVYTENRLFLEVVWGHLMAHLGKEGEEKEEARAEG